MTKIPLALGFACVCLGLALIVTAVIWYAEQLYGVFADGYVENGVLFL